MEFAKVFDAILEELGMIRGLLGKQADRIVELGRELRDLREIADGQSAQIAMLREAVDQRRISDGEEACDA